MRSASSLRTIFLVVVFALFVSTSVIGQDAPPDDPAAHDSPERVLVVRVRVFDQNYKDATGYVKLLNVDSGKILGILDDCTKVLTDNDALLGQAVLAPDDKSNIARQWRIEKDEDGQLKIINRKSGQVLDLYQSRHIEGAAIIQWPEWQPKYSNQRFEWQGEGTDRRLMNKCSGMVLDVDDDGKIIQATSDPASKTQLWRVVKVTD